MSLQVAPSYISPQDASDLLHKLITEATDVEAVLWGRSGIMATVRGFVSRRPNGTVHVATAEITGPSLSFGLKDVAEFKYGDRRAFPPRDFPELPCRLSALIFVYPDNTRIFLFELGTA